MNLGLPEMIFIFLLALIIFGPKKLPEIGRQVGKALNDFKRASNEFKAQIESEIGNMDPVRVERPRVERPQVAYHVDPPTDPPDGTVASGQLTEEIEPVPPLDTPVDSHTGHAPELNNVAKGPDA